jgi:hypothetical protein
MEIRALAAVSAATPATAIGNPFAVFLVGPGLSRAFSTIAIIASPGFAIGLLKIFIFLAFQLVRFF